MSTILIYESNYKKVTQDMRDITQSTSEDENFNIIEFVRDLKYQAPIHMRDDIILAPIPEYIPVLDVKYLNGITISDKIYIPNREPANFIMVDNAIIVFFIDHRSILKGNVSNMIITWNNGTIWYPEDRSKWSATVS